MEVLFTVKEASNLWRISKGKLYQLVENRKIQHFRIDARVLFSEQQLEQYLDSRRVESEKNH